MSPSIDASHITAQMNDELTAAEDARWRRIDAAKAAKPATAKSAPKPAAKAPSPKPAAPRNVVVKKSAPRPSPPSTPELPPGSVVVSPEEMEAIDIAVEYYTEHHPITTHSGSHERF